MKYILGLDLGIASIGWSVLGLNSDEELTHIVDTGVIIPELMEDEKGNLKNTDRRSARGARRTLRRRKHRKERIYKLLREEFKKDFKGVNISDVYKLRVKGLKDALTVEELAVVLIHYAKHRGFKSNRKNEQSGEAGKILKAIAQNKEKIEGKEVSEFLFEELTNFKGKEKIKNSGDKYLYSFLRSDIEAEIEKLLANQVAEGLVTADFKENYQRIWSDQRDFSDGPGGNSPYKVDFANVFGRCSMEQGEYRAPRRSFTQEKHVMLTRLHNLRYKLPSEKNYLQLTPEEIKDLVPKLIAKKESKYSDISKYLKKGTLKYKGLRVSKAEYIALKKQYPDNKMSPEEFQNLLLKEMEKKIFGTFEGLHTIKSAFKSEKLVAIFDELLERKPEYLDDIARGLTFYKTDNRIKAYFMREKTDRIKEVSPLDWSEYQEVIEKVIPKIKDSVFTEAGSLSLKVLRIIEPLMLEGIEYSEAMARSGYNHAEKERGGELRKKLPLIIDILEEQFPGEVNNPRVIRVLSKVGGLINSCVDRYGSPAYIHIEVARDINLRSDKRRRLEDEQLDNLTKRARIKEKILESKARSSASRISKYDIEKFLLYEEQGGICPYSLTKISEGDVLSADYEVDHIIPYSKCGINTRQNKTLVLKKENQQKGNREAFAYIKEAKPDRVEEYRRLISSFNSISDDKKEFYLTASFDPANFNERSINDTRYITKTLVSILENNLIMDGAGERKVKSFKAGYVNQYKKGLGLQYLTHSLEAKDYKKSTRYRFDSLKISNTSSKESVTLFYYDDENPLIDDKVKNLMSVEVKYLKENKNTPFYKVEQNKALVNFTKNANVYDLEVIKNKPFHKNNDELTIYEVIERDYGDYLEKAITDILLYLEALIQKSAIKKDRGNHLHHALDATAVAALNNSTEQKLAKYIKDMEAKRERLKNGPIELESGEIIGSLEEFDRQELTILKSIVKPPFEGFDKELKAFIYERDEVKQREMVTGNFERNLKPLIPVQLKKRRYEIKGNNGQEEIRVGRLHKETVKGVRGDDLVRRVSTSDYFKGKKDKKLTDALNNIVGADGHAKHVYEACKEWAGNGFDGEYPTLSNGRPIKKVMIKDGEKKNGLKLERGYVHRDNVVRIDIYKGEGDERLYFRGLGALEVIKEFKGIDGEESAVFWYGQGANKVEGLLEKLKTNYQKVLTLHPGDLVEIEKKDESRGIAYVVGFGSGLFEVEDIIGDNFYLSDKFLVKKERERIQFTASTIKSIKKLKLNIRGELK